MSFPCPTPEEIAAASDSITKDDPGAQANAMLSILCQLSKPLRDATTLKVQLLRAAVSAAPDFDHLDGGDQIRELLAEAADEGLHPLDIFLESTVSALTVYGLNLGIRIGEARREGLRKRGSIESLLAHYREGCTGVHSTETQAAVISVLRWVLGEQELP